MFVSSGHAVILQRKGVTGEHASSLEKVPTAAPVAANCSLCGIRCDLSKSAPDQRCGILIFSLESAGNVHILNISTEPAE